MVYICGVYIYVCTAGVHIHAYLAISEVSDAFSDVTLQLYVLLESSSSGVILILREF